jgi:hypothetical protein
MRTLRTRIALALLALLSLACGVIEDLIVELDQIEDIIATPDVPDPTPNIVREPATDLTAETARLLEESVIPPRDLHELAIRLSGLPANTPLTINPAGSPDYPVGTTRVFHVSNTDTDTQFDINATLHYKTEHVYMWVEDGISFDQQDLAEAAEYFEQNTYPTNRSFFGSEWSPGVDNDPHVSILHARGLGSVGGYYSSSDEFVSAVREDSNEMEMFYISMDYEVINGEDYHSVLAHEFQHMIHWYNDRNEPTWLNEGFSELAAYLNGFDPGSYAVASFAGRPDNQLNDIDYDAPDGFASYGAGYLFASYFLDRYGPDATQTLVSHPDNGFAAVDVVLESLGTGTTHEDLFADWTIANLLDDTSLSAGQHGYQQINPPNFQVETQLGSYDYPAVREATVRQYGVDYIELHGETPLSLSFVGSTQVRLVDTEAHSGQYLWWSNRGDDSDMTMTRAFDLSGMDSATLEFWTWYDIEENWDYAYVQVSTDDGQTWEILTTPSGTPTNPNGNSFGWAYTGMSGTKGSADWILEQVDLTPYAGQQVLIRFEYITDDAVNRPGFVVDDIAIPEIGYSSDFEDGTDGWEAEGFVRHANALPQRFVVQMVLFGSETTVQRLELAEDQTGQWQVPLGGDIDRAIISVSGIAPVTTEPASYHYEVAIGGK